MPDPLSRRMFIRRLSSGSLAIAALGMTALACNADEPTGTSSTAPSADPTSSTTPPSATTTTSAAPTTESPTSTAAPAGDATWQRVNLGFVSAYVVVRDGEAAIIDTGNEGSARDIERALGSVGSNWDDVGHVILTHLHPDHVGSLPAVITSATGATAYAHEADIPGIRSPRPITPVADAEAVFGLNVIHTPGHTPGHIALLDPQLEVLFAGDAINGADPGVAGPNPRFTPDMPLAIESARRLGTFEYETVVFGHGEPVVGGAAAAVAVMAAEL